VSWCTCEYFGYFFFPIPNPIPNAQVALKAMSRRVREIFRNVMSGS
jgi:hypothetical protein